MQPVKTVEWLEGTVRILDQRRLPLEVAYLECSEVEQVAEAIETLAVRGAPAIGVAAALGVALAAWRARAAGVDRLRRDVADAIGRLGKTRPTAVNLFWALDRMGSRAREGNDSDSIGEGLVQEALTMQREDEDSCKRIGAYGAPLLHDGWTVLTHCNAGALATAGWGTALALIYEAHSQGKSLSVIVDETRPLLQGARLTTWELREAGIPVTLICDGMAAWAMAQGRVNCVVTGADRIAANGDVANKIGTYGLGVLARHHEVPLIVAAPFTTVDLSLRRGGEIPIEERTAREVTEVQGRRIAPHGIAVYNPAFDVTPADLVTAIVTDCGVAYPPYRQSLRELADGHGSRAARE